LILKEKPHINATTSTAKSGLKQEQDVAFFLRRNFKDDDRVLVFNDLKFSYNNETAQIDHLILYPFGFILIESKSITGEVSVNKQQEWSRSYQGRWQGMPSPIKQVELQQVLLRELMFECREQILGKVLFKQQSFGGRCWHNICAISSNTIIDRIEMPASISDQLVKSEFLADRLKKIMKLRHKVINAINFIDTRPSFCADEMASITDFLLSHDISNGQQKSLQPVHKTNETKRTDVWLIKKPQVSPEIKTISLCCSKCQATTKLVPTHGKYGYYLKCQQCNGNTAMKQPCPHCNSKQAKVSKRKDNYTLNCQECDQQTKYKIG